MTEGSPAPDFTLPSTSGESDLKREVSRRFGVLDEDRFVARRAYVLVDRQGTVRWRFTENTPGTRRENAELLSRIEALS